MQDAVWGSNTKAVAQNRVKSAKRASVEHEAKLRVAPATKTSCGSKLTRRSELNIFHTGLHYAKKCKRIKCVSDIFKMSYTQNKFKFLPGVSDKPKGSKIIFKCFFRCFKNRF